MKLVMANAVLKSFKEALKVCKDLMLEARFFLQPEGLIVREMDPANVCLFELKINPDTCIVYEPYDKPINVNLKNFINLLGKDSINITLNETSDSLVIVSDGFKNELKILTSEKDTLTPMPGTTETPLNFKATSHIGDAKLYVDFLKKASKVGETVTISQDKWLVVGDNASTEAPWNGNEERAKYSLEYFEKIFTKQVRSVDYGTDYPIRVNYEFVNGLQLTTILAPWVDNEV